MDTYRSHKIIMLAAGLALIGFGLLLLLSELFEFNFWGSAWPFFIIVPGLCFFAGMVLGGKGGGPLAVPGSIVTTVGLILLYQNLTGHWASWAYAWALIFPTSVGVGIAIAGIWGDDPRAVRTGTIMAAVGVVVFLVFGVFFELVLNLGGLRSGALGGWLLPLLLVGAGLAVVLAGRRGKRHV